MRDKQSDFLNDFVVHSIVQTVKVANKDDTGTVWKLVLGGILILGILAKVF